MTQLTIVTLSQFYIAEGTAVLNTHKHTHIWKNLLLTCLSGSNSSIFRTSTLFAQMIIGLFVNNGLMLLNNSI